MPPGEQLFVDTFSDASVRLIEQSRVARNSPLPQYSVLYDLDDRINPRVSRSVFDLQAVIHVDVVLGFTASGEEDSGSCR